MKDTVHALLALAALSGLAGLTACGSPSKGDVIGESDMVTTEGAAKKHVFHYEPSVEGVTFAPGCGIVRPDVDGTTTGCYSGFVLTFTKSYIDLQSTITHRTNNTTHTIDVVLDTWSTSKVHPMVMARPQDEQLGGLEAQMGTTYAVTVWDRHHVALWSGNVRPMYAY